MSEHSEVIEERDGYRVRIVIDEDSGEPEDDGATPILRLHKSRDYWSGYRATAFNRQAEEWVDVFNRFEATGTRWHLFERYLRIFHGGRSFATFNTGLSYEDGYIAFDTAAWRERAGITDYHQRTISDDQADESMAELRAWVLGDVWGVIVEEYATGACGHQDCDEHMEWREVEAVWGHYGREFAEQAAREALIDVIKAYQGDDDEQPASP